MPPVPLAGNGTQGHSRSRLTLAASSVYTPPPLSGLGAWVPGMVENIRSQLHLPSQADALQASGSNNMVWAVDGKPACHAPGPVPSHPPPRLQRLWRNSAAVGDSAWRRWRWGECAWERPRTRSLGASVAGKADESDSVGTSGRKGRESRGISEGTLGLWRLGVGLGCCVRAWPGKRLAVEGRGGPPGRGVQEEQRWGLWLGWGRQRAEELSALEPEGQEPSCGIRDTEALSVRDVGDAGKLLPGQRDRQP